MRRRRLLRLAAGASGATSTALLAGCASTDRRGRVTRTTATATRTPPEPITDCRALPDPPTDPSPRRAREFVATAEEARVHNWLVVQNGGPAECSVDGPGVRAEADGAGGAVEVTVEPARTAVTAETDRGVYVVSACSGEARYWCPEDGRVCSSAGTNERFVTHFVGDGRHVRVPDNFVGCHASEAPYRAPDDDENVPVPDREPAMTFRVYDFGAGEEPRAVDATVTHLASGEEVVAGTYEPPAGPAVVSNVAARRAVYELVAESATDRVTHEFALTGRDDPAWHGLCVYLGPDGDLTVAEVGTNGDLAPDGGSCLRFAGRERE